MFSNSVVQGCIIKTASEMSEWHTDTLIPCRNPDEGDAEFRERIKKSIDPREVTLTIDGQTIEMIPGEPVVGYSAPAEVPATYEEICPRCNGSKEVTGWLGKETCNAC